MGIHQNKIIAVTGGASGLGESICHRLAKEGASVAVIDVNDTKGAQVANTLEGAKYFHGDVTDPEEIGKTFAMILDSYGRLDGAVNNAGIGGQFAPIADFPLEVWQRLMNVNLNGVFYCLRQQIPIMQKQKSGAIVNMASICGHIGQAGIGGYVATKHAILGLTKNVALEYGRDGVRCTAVCPSYIKTPLTENEFTEEIWTDLESRHATGQLVLPEDTAAMVSFLLSDDAKSVTGSSHLVDGGFIT